MSMVYPILMKHCSAYQHGRIEIPNLVVAEFLVIALRCCPPTLRQTAKPSTAILPIPGIVVLIEYLGRQVWKRRRRLRLL